MTDSRGGRKTVQPNPVSTPISRDMELLLYSEWLDVQGLMPSSGDGRTHDDLVRQFLRSSHKPPNWLAEPKEQP